MRLRCPAPTSLRSCALPLTLLQGPMGCTFGVGPLQGTGAHRSCTTATWRWRPGTPPVEFNMAEMAFIPKTSPLDGRTMLRVACGGVRPLTLSNTSQKNVARAANLTLAMYAEHAVDGLQRGFIKGRKLLDNRFDMDCTLIEAHKCGAGRCGVALFDVAAALPSLEWR